MRRLRVTGEQLRRQAMAVPRRTLCAVSPPPPSSMSAICIETVGGESLGDMKAIRGAGDDVTLALRPEQAVPQLQPG